MKMKKKTCSCFRKRSSLHIKVTSRGESLCTDVTLGSAPATMKTTLQKDGEKISLSHFLTLPLCDSPALLLDSLRDGYFRLLMDVSVTRCHDLPWILQVGGCSEPSNKLVTELPSGTVSDVHCHLASCSSKPKC